MQIKRMVPGSDPDLTKRFSMSTLVMGDVEYVARCRVRPITFLLHGNSDLQCAAGQYRGVSDARLCKRP